MRMCVRACADVQAFLIFRVSLFLGDLCLLGARMRDSKCEKKDVKGLEAEASVWAEKNTARPRVRLE
jgi:hypothetical protein